MAKTILIICTMNICRSPMAAAILRHRLAAAGLVGRVRVLSAGIWASAGQKASEPAIAVLAQRGIALDDHRSQPVTVQLFEESELVLVMEENHRRSLFNLSPRHLGKVFLLTEMSGHHEDVADPYGGPPEAYVRTVEGLEKLIDEGLPEILRHLKIQAKH